MGNSQFIDISRWLEKLWERGVPPVSTVDMEQAEHRRHRPLR